MPQDLLKLVDRKDLDAESSGNLIQELLNPANEAAWKGAILGSWACKGETAEEIAGFALELRARALDEARWRLPCRFVTQRECPVMHRDECARTQFDERAQRILRRHMHLASARRVVGADEIGRAHV